MYLTLYTPAHLAALSALQVPAGQEKFTAYPAELIAQTAADPDSLGVTILADIGLDGETPVDYFVLSVGAQRDKYLPKPGPAGVAIRAVPELVRRHFPQAEHVFLMVNGKNAHARRVYEKAGYAVWFQRGSGEHGPQWVMRRELG